MGSDGYKQLLRERKECFSYLKSKLETLGANTNEKALVTPNNSISIAFSLSGLGGSQKDFTQIGSMLFTRNVTGVRVVAPGDTKEIGGVVFQNFNSHYNSYPCVYLTAAATIGIKKDEIDVFIKRKNIQLPQATPEALLFFLSPIEREEIARNFSHRDNFAR